ncbi:diguanylate cyclase, partial [Pseudomonas syringae pv. tagetis]|uniref:diguanylate cyclase domain-containing protein n=1 Tax=Pseudomonas syringae group genomosp. 7 TaxID=251699 RepID=UPI00376F74C6
AGVAFLTAFVLVEGWVRDRSRVLDLAIAWLLLENSHVSLTGLPYRSHLQHRVKQAWQNFCLDGRQLFVLFIVLDRFK